MEINETLKKLRQERHLTQQELAAALDINLSSYQKYERPNNTVKPSIEALIKLADFYGISVDYLLGREQADSSEAVVAQYMQLPEEMRKSLMELLIVMAENPNLTDKQAFKAAAMNVFSVMLDYISTSLSEHPDTPESSQQEDRQD